MSQHNEGLSSFKGLFLIKGLVSTLGGDFGSSFLQ